jgi:hypothetical protein
MARRRDVRNVARSDLARQLRGDLARDDVGIDADVGSLPLLGDAARGQWKNSEERKASADTAEDHFPIPTSRIDAISRRSQRERCGCRDQLVGLVPVRAPRPADRILE